MTSHKRALLNINLFHNSILVYIIRSMKLSNFHKEKKTGQIICPSFVDDGELEYKYTYFLTMFYITVRYHRQ